MPSIPVPSILSESPSADRHRKPGSLISDHLYLIEQIARRLHRRLPRSALLDDLRGDGALGLLSAARNYDPGRGVSFATFASRRIQGAMVDGLRDMDPAANFRRAKMRNEAKSPGRCDRSAAFHASGTSGRYGAIPKTCCFEAVVRNEPTVDALRARIPRPEHRLEIRDLLATLLRQLPGSARRIIYYKWIKELEQKDLAKRWGVSQARISARHTRAMFLLRQIADVPNKPTPSSACRLQPACLPPPP